MSNFRNLLKKSEEMLTHGCPVKVSVPLLLGVSASVALTAFEVRSDIDDACTLENLRKPKATASGSRK